MDAPNKEARQIKDKDKSIAPNSGNLSDVTLKPKLRRYPSNWIELTLLKAEAKSRSDSLSPEIGQKVGAYTPRGCLRQVRLVQWTAS
jgi:hypothetical protein